MSHEDHEVVREERIVYLVLVVVAALVIAGFMFQRGLVDGGVALCMAMGALGSVGLVASFRRRAMRIPPARVRKPVAARFTARSRRRL